MEHHTEGLEEAENVSHEMSVGHPMGVTTWDKIRNESLLSSVNEVPIGKNN